MYSLIFFIFIYKSSTNLFLEVLNLVTDYFLPSWVWRGFDFSSLCWLLKFMFGLIYEMMIKFGILILYDSCLTECEVNEILKPPETFWVGILNVIWSLAIFFWHHVSEASHKYQHGPPTLKAEMKGQLRELVLAVFWSSCPPIGEISRHRHRCYQAVWACNSAVTLLNKRNTGELAIGKLCRNFGGLWIVAGNNLPWGTC